MAAAVCFQLNLTNLGAFLCFLFSFSRGEGGALGRGGVGVDVYVAGGNISGNP